MVNHQIHFERKFYKDKKYGYWISTDYPRIRAHRWVWISIHGLIPKGYEIHHKNEDKSDNRIENLELIHKSRHLSHHMMDPKKKERAREHASRIRPMTKAWHASEEGRASHRLQALKSNFGNWGPFKYTCQICSKEYESKKISNTKFCSNACKSAFRRKSGLDNITRKCEYCQGEFITDKYQKIRFCCRGCGQKSRKKIDE